ncbi:MAG TPA: nucleotidyl transferase AbiEii/AbiGii toxin family protein [Smithella sp.]|nr:nucleotidyl transferase AbiEii/AbiGii toxin family protein [Smithella sp.]
MITRQEIMDASREFGLGAHIIEKDYVLGWLLNGISKHAVIGHDWIFKGGTCLKKCYFETYRFSEDLDFTLMQESHLNVDFLTAAFREIIDSIYESTGLEIPKDMVRFEIYENPRGKLSAEGRLSYRGPMQQRGDMPRIKLDLTANEIISLPPVMREVQHPYSDKPEKGIFVQCYSFEEVFAEKIRALAERLRPRDLYDVINLYHHNDVSPDHVLLNKTLKQKCDFKGIALPSAKSLADKPERAELAAEWKNMLAHQLPALPSYEQFWQELPEMFEWLYGTVRKAAVAPISSAGKEIDTTLQMPAMSQIWHDRTSSPLHLIRFAAANHLCVNLQYQGTTRLIEPYSLRMTKDGNLLLYAVKHDTREDRSYRVDRISDAHVSDIPFVPRYKIELTESGPLSAPPVAQRSISHVPKS